MEKRENDAKDSFVNERIGGSVNMWDQMKKVKLLNWYDLICKKSKPKSGAKDVQLKSTNALFSRLLVIGLGLSERHIDLQNTISDYEFNAINPVLMKPDDTLLSCIDNSELVHALDELVVFDVQHQTQGSRALMNKFIIIDGMAVVQAIIHTGKFRTCKDLGQAFSKGIDRYSEDYVGTRVIFDNYSDATFLNSELRYASSREYLIVDDSTQIQD